MGNKLEFNTKDTHTQSKFNHTTLLTDFFGRRRRRRKIANSQQQSKNLSKAKKKFSDSEISGTHTHTKMR